MTCNLVYYKFCYGFKKQTLLKKTFKTIYKYNN